VESVCLLHCTCLVAFTAKLCISGRALAVKLHEAGKAVVIAGRRQENLDELFRQLGHERVFPVQWDITDLAGIPVMVEAIARNYGNKLSAVVIVSGIQRTTDFTTPKVSALRATFLSNFTRSPGTRL
jgi:uncharacterized oxidoreductase